MPVTPMADSASRTSSSLNGLMIAVTSFIGVPRGSEGRPPASLESLLDVDHPGALGDVARVDTIFGGRPVAHPARVAGVGVERADGEVLGQRVAQAELPVLVRAQVVVEGATTELLHP